MGGRGSSGGGSGGGFKAPAMSGTEKQVAYARDILKRPYDNLGQAAAVADRNVKRFEATIPEDAKKYRGQAAAYRAAQKEYAKGVSELKAPSGQLSASMVIERKNRFGGIAEKIAESEFRKRKLSLIGVHFNF